MPGPLLLIFGPLLPAFLIAIGLRRRPVAAGVSGFAATLLLGVVIAAIPLQTSGAQVSGALFAGGEADLLGQSFLLTASLQRLFSSVYAGAAFLFLLCALWPQGPEFVPVGMAALSPLAFTTLVQPFTFGAVALLAVAAMAVVMIQARRPASTPASVRYFLLTALAVPAFLVAGLLLNSEQAVLSGTAWQLLLVGLGLLLAGFPFHVWVRPLVEEANPLVSVYVLALVPAVIVAFAGQILQQQAGLPGMPRFSSLLALSGAATALFAAYLAATAPGKRGLLAYLVLADVGATILGLSQGAAGMGPVWALLLSRFVSLSLAMIGLILLERWAVETTTPARSAWTRRERWATVLFIFGALSLVGLPLTPGFAARWSIVALMATESMWLALTLLLAVAGGTAGVMRSLTVSDERSPDRAHRPATQDARLQVGAAAVAGGVGLILALHPWPLLNFAHRLVALF